MELIWQFTTENKNSKNAKPFLKLFYLQKKSSLMEVKKNFKMALCQ